MRKGYRLGASHGDAEGIIFEIVNTVADLENKSPLDLTPPLEAAIDTDALEKVIGSDDGVAVEFEYLGWEIRVEDTGRVRVLN